MKITHSATRSFFSLKVVIPALVILLAAAGAYAMIKTAPKAQKRPPATTAPSVEVYPLHKQDYQIWIPAMGTVIAARDITLESRVSGEVTSINPSFAPGGYFAAGEELLRINPEDYELALDEVRADVTNAEYNLKVEQGYQNVADREWNLLKSSAKGTDSEAELALRKPHLEKAKADLSAAQAKLRQARLDLKRTVITAPFAAMVETKNTDIGAAVSLQESLATLVGTDEFWIQASVPVDRLNLIDIPIGKGEEGPKVVITMEAGGKPSTREGKLIKLLPSLDEQGRMARVLISIKDPLNLQGEKGVKPLLLGSYVKVSIDGGALKDVYPVPREAFRENNTVWLLTDKGTLDIRSVKPVWRDEETIVLDENVADQERLVTTHLSTPLQGMALHAMEEVRATASRPGTDTCESVAMKEQAHE